MSTTTDSTWLTSQDIPPRPTETDLLAFFGIPPDPKDRLDDNIRKKRQYWHAKTSGPAGKDLAKRIKAKIIEVERAIKRGAAASGDGAAPQFNLDEAISSLEDVWRVIQELVFADQFERALEQSVAAIGRWPDAAAPHAVYAWVVAVATETGAFVAEPEAAAALRSADTALRLNPDDEITWTSKTHLHLYGGEFDAALQCITDAERHFGKLDPDLRISRLVVHLMHGRYEESLTDAIVAVDQGDGDAAVRSRCTVLLVRQLLPRLLPIDGPARLAAYVEAVDVAAWCARGVPEAEDLVRPHLMWSQLAAGRTFAGGYVLRCFFATLTGLLSLPLSNSLRSKPVWKVFLDGPAGSVDAWSFLGHKDFVKEVHAPVLSRLPWSWPADRPDGDG